MYKVKQLLDKLISLDGDIDKLEEEYQKAILTYGYDNIYDITNLSLDNVKNILLRYTNENITYQQLYLWSSVLDVNDHIKREEKYDTLIYHILFEISHPELYGQISKERASELINEIELEEKIN